MGHPAEQVWDYTPRQLVAFLFIANRRRQREHMGLLYLHSLAAQGDEKAIKAEMKRLSR